MAAAARRVDWTLAVIAFLSVGVALASLRYLVPGAPGGAPDILANPMAQLGVLTVHAGLAATALTIGPFQFITGLRLKWPSLHRRLGTVYVACCLAGGVAGLLLAFRTTAGPIASAGFGLLALAWIGVNVQAWRHARARRFDLHQRWMIRSFALTFAAVTLRLYLPIAPMLGYDFMPAYRAISFLCWVPNLIVAELILRSRFAPGPVRMR